MDFDFDLKVKPETLQKYFEALSRHSLGSSDAALYFKWYLQLTKNTPFHFPRLRRRG